MEDILLSFRFSLIDVITIVAVFSMLSYLIGVELTNKNIQKQAKKEEENLSKRKIKFINLK